VHTIVHTFARARDANLPQYFLVGHLYPAHLSHGWSADQRSNMRSGGATVHYYHADSEKIRGLQPALKQSGLKGKVVLKNNHTHVFHDTPISYEKKNTFAQILGPGWSACSGCMLCTKPAKEKKKIKYVVYPPMILIPTSSSIDIADARQLLEENRNCTHVALNAPIITGDIVRHPQIEPVIGNFGQFVATDEPSPQDFDCAFWATSIQNGIFQTWAPLYTMFSRGNVTEKKRVLDTFNCQRPIGGSTVIDLYSGIGYFSFPYAKQNPKIIYCWEINPWSVEGMMRAAVRNKISCRVIRNGTPYEARPNDRIVIFLEDNQTALRRMNQLNLANVSHINMGLLPHARDAIPVAMQLSDQSSSKPVIHLHENVDADKLEGWKNDMGSIMGRTCLHVEKIKQFSPRVYHVCGDFV